MSHSTNMFLVKVFAAALLCAPIGCIASSEPAPEATSASSAALMTAADLPDYGFTALYFGDDKSLKAGLTITDPAGVPLTFTIEGVDKSGTQKVTSTVKLVSIDATAKIGLYALSSGEPLGGYNDLVPPSKVASPTYKTLSLVNYDISFIYNCKVSMKPPGPPRCYTFKVPTN